MQTRFDQPTYRQRAQVETTISMIKRRQGNHIRGRTYWSQTRELRLMVLTHNVVIRHDPLVRYTLIQSPLIASKRNTAPAKFRAEIEPFSCATSVDKGTKLWDNRSPSINPLFWFCADNGTDILANPDVAESNRVAMILDVNRQFVWVRRVVWRLVEKCSTLQREVVVNHDAIVQYRDVGGLYQFSLSVELGGLEDDVIRLPLARLARRVDGGRGLLVDGSALSVEVGFVFVGVENLQLVPLHQKHPAVPAALALSDDFGGCREFQMQLATAEPLFCLDAPPANFGVTIFNFPISPLERGQIRPIEQDDRVARGLLRIAGIHDRWFWPDDAT